MLPCVTQPLLILKCHLFWGQTLRLWLLLLFYFLLPLLMHLLLVDILELWLWMAGLCTFRQAVQEQGLVDAQALQKARIHKMNIAYIT